MYVDFAFYTNSGSCRFFSSLSVDCPRKTSFWSISCLISKRANFFGHKSLIAFWLYKTTQELLIKWKIVHCAIRESLVFGFEKVRQIFSVTAICHNKNWCRVAFACFGWTSCELFYLSFFVHPQSISFFLGKFVFAWLVILLYQSCHLAGCHCPFCRAIYHHLIW